MGMRSVTNPTRKNALLLSICEEGTKVGLMKVVVVKLKVDSQDIPLSRFLQTQTSSPQK